MKVLTSPRDHGQLGNYRTPLFAVLLKLVLARTLYLMRSMCQMYGTSRTHPPRVFLL